MTKFKLRLLLVFAFLIFGIPSYAEAQTLPVSGSTDLSGPTIIQYKKKTTINLDESSIRGDLNEFGHMEISIPGGKNFKNPIHLRTHFLKELRDESLYSR